MSGTARSTRTCIAEARYGDFGYYFPLLANSDTTAPEIFDNQQTLLTGADQKEQTDRRRRQATGSVTYFKDGWGGTHNFKVGGEMLFEYGWYGYTQVASGNQRDTIGTNGAPQLGHVVRADRAPGRQPRRRPERQPAQRRRVNTEDFFVTDQYTVGRATFNLGVRYDGYDVFTPDQTAARVHVPDRRLDCVGVRDQSVVLRDALREVELVRAAPRHVLRPDRHRQDRAEGATTACTGSTRASASRRARTRTRQTKSITYAWTDARSGCAACIPGDQTYQDGEDTARADRAALAGTITVDPNIAQPYSHQATAYVEQQLTEGVGLRVGFVYYSVKNQTGTFQPNRPASAYTVPFNVVDPGPDGITGNARRSEPDRLRHPERAGLRLHRDATTPTPTCAYPTNQVITERGRTTAPTRRSSSR